MLIYALTIFASAFLLFLVQPIMAKQILPWFGGSAAVWTTCLMFFQLVLLFGYGFPRYRGGPLKWADLQGLDTVLADIERFAAEDAWFWQPSTLLKTLVADGRNFDDLNRAGAK